MHLAQVDVRLCILSHQQDAALAAVKAIAPQFDLMPTLIGPEEIVSAATLLEVLAAFGLESHIDVPTRDLIVDEFAGLDSDDYGDPNAVLSLYELDDVIQVALGELDRLFRALAPYVDHGAVTLDIRAHGMVRWSFGWARAERSVWSSKRQRSQGLYEAAWSAHSPVAG